MKVFEKIKLVLSTLFAAIGLYKSDRGYISGVCSGIAEKFNINPTIVRLAWIISIPISLTGTLLIYILLSLVMPKKMNSNSPKYFDDYIDVNSREI